MSTKPKPLAPAPKSDSRLEWRTLLKWLLEDGLIDEPQVQRTEQRLGAGDSSLHPLVRLGHANLVRLTRCPNGWPCAPSCRTCASIRSRSTSAASAT